MSIIFPLFGTGTPQTTDTDGYFLDGTNLKRIKSESFEIDTLFSNVSGFFVDRKENLYTSGGGNVKKYRKFGGSFSLVWQVSGGFSGGATMVSDSRDRGFNYGSYPFTSDFANVAVDSQLNFYFRNNSDGNKLYKYSPGGQLITSTNSSIGAFAINQTNIFSIGFGITKRDLSGNSISSFTVTGSIRALGSNQVFTEEEDSETFRFPTSGSLTDKVHFNTVRAYNLVNGNLAWSVNRLINEHSRRRSSNEDRDDLSLNYKYISLKNGNLLILVNAFDLEFAHDNRASPDHGNQFYGYVLISPTGQILHLTDLVRFTGSINSGSDVAGITIPDRYALSELNNTTTDIAQYLITQGANSDRSRLNF